MKNVKFIVIFVFVILSLVSFGYTHELFQASANFSLGFLVYGSETREESFSITVPDVLLNVTTTNNIFLCHFD